MFKYNQKKLIQNLFKSWAKRGRAPSDSVGSAASFISWSSVHAHNFVYSSTEETLPPPSLSPPSWV